jgi:hypothetical protein
MTRCAGKPAARWLLYRSEKLPEADFVKIRLRVLHRSLDPQLAAKVAHLTIAELKRILLSPQARVGSNIIEMASQRSCCRNVKIMT